MKKLISESITGKVMVIPLGNFIVIPFYFFFALFSFKKYFLFDSPEINVISNFFKILLIKLQVIVKYNYNIIHIQIQNKIPVLSNQHILT